MASDIIIYQTEDGQTKIEAHFEDETVWLSLAQMVELFQKAKSTVSEHIKNIFDEGELDREPTVRKFRTVKIIKNIAMCKICTLLVQTVPSSFIIWMSLYRLGIE